jgi:hypothetical protein
VLVYKRVSQKETNPYLRIINIKYNVKMIVLSRMPFDVPFDVPVLILKTKRWHLMLVL